MGTFPWGPVLDVNMTIPGDDWYEGWKEQDWHFLKETPEELVNKGAFNRDLQYMSGVTTQEAAFVICSYHNIKKIISNRMFLQFIDIFR